MYSSNQSENYSQISEDKDLQVEYFKGIQRQDSSIQYLKNIGDENSEKQINARKEQAVYQSEAQISYKKGKSTSQKTSESYSENFSQINPLNRDFDQSRGLTRQREAGEIQADTSRSSVKQQIQDCNKDSLKLNANNFSIDQVQKLQRKKTNPEKKNIMKYQEQYKKLNLDKDSEIFTAQSMSHEDIKIKDNNDESPSLDGNGQIVYNNSLKNQHNHDFIKIHKEMSEETTESNMATKLQELKSMHKKRSDIVSEATSFPYEKKRQSVQLPQANDILNKQIENITFSEKHQIQINKLQKPTSPNQFKSNKMQKNNYQQDLLQNILNEQNKALLDQKIAQLEKQKSRSRISFSATQNFKPYINKLLNQELRQSPQSNLMAGKQQIAQIYNMSPKSHIQKDDLYPTLAKNQILSNQVNITKNSSNFNRRQGNNFIVKPNQTIYNSQKYFDSSQNLLSSKAQSILYLNASQISGQASINSNRNSFLSNKHILNKNKKTIKNYQSPESTQNFTKEEINYLNQQASQKKIPIEIFKKFSAYLPIKMIQKTTPKKNSSLTQIGLKSVSPQFQNLFTQDLINSSDNNSSTQFMLIQNDQNNYQKSARKLKNKKQKSRVFSANTQNKKSTNFLVPEDQNQKNYNAFIKYLQQQIDRSEELPPREKNSIFGAGAFTPKNDNGFLQKDLDRMKSQSIYQKKFRIGDAQLIQLQQHHKIRASSRMQSVASGNIKKAELIEEIQILKSQIASLDYQNMNYKTQIQQQNEDLNFKDNFIQELMRQQKHTQKSLIISGKESFKDDSQSLQSDLKNIKSENATNTSSKKNIKNQYSNSKEQTEQKVDISYVIELKELVQVKNYEIEVLKCNTQKLLAAQDEIKKYKSQIKQLKHTTQDQFFQIEKLQQQVNALKQDVHDQQAKDMQIPAQDSGPNINYLEINNNLKKEIQQLDEKNTQSVLEIKDLKEEINKLKETIHQKNLQETILQDKIKSLYKQISDLQATVIQTNQDFIQFQEQMKKQSNQLQQKEEEVQKEQVKDEKIFEEIQKIQSKLLEWDCAFSDDRSDIQSAISQIATPELNNFNFNKFGSPKRNTSLYNKNDKNFVAVIEMESENDSNSQTDDNVSHVYIASDSQPNSSAKIINSSMTQVKFLGQMGRSSTEQGLKQGLSQFRRQQTHIQKMNDQINRINKEDCTIVTDDASHYGGVSQFHRIAQEKNSYQTVFVEKNDPVVQISFQRIARLQQIKRISIDQVEIEIFGKQLKTYKSISIQQLTQVFINKLDLSTSEAILFSRFLIEEPTDEQEESGDRSVQFEIERKANAQLIAVRLMAHSLYPRIYNQQNDKDALDAFEVAFKTKKQKFNLVQEVLNFQNKIITFDEFKYFIKQAEKSSDQDLKENIIECAFIILSKACSDSEIQNLPKERLFQMFQGFFKENILFLFRNKYTLDDLKKEEPRLIFGHSNQDSSRQSDQNNDFTPVIGGRMQTGQFADYEESGKFPIHVENQGSELKNKPKLKIGISMIDIPFNPNQVNNNFKKQQTQENIINKDKMIDHSPDFKESNSPRRMKKELQSFGQVTVHNSSDHGEQKSQSTEIKHKISPEFSEKRLENIPEEKDKASQDFEIPQYSDSRSEEDFDMQESLGFKTNQLQNQLQSISKEIQKQEKDQILNKVQKEVINLYMSFCAKSETYRTQQNMYQNQQLDSFINTINPTIELTNELQNKYLNQQTETCETHEIKKDEIVQEDGKNILETQDTKREQPHPEVIDKMINPCETLQTQRMPADKVISEGQFILVDGRFDKLFGQLISNRLYSFFQAKIQSPHGVFCGLARLALKMRGVQLLQEDVKVEGSLWLVNYDVLYADANQLQYQTLRELFRDDDESLVMEAQSQNYCFEVVKSADFIGKINFMLNQSNGQLNNNWRQNLPLWCLDILDDYSTLDLDTINALLAVFQVPNHPDYINFTQFQKLINLLGVQELQIQDLQAQIDYNLLNIQSIKILNKLIDFLSNMKLPENQKTNIDQFTQNLQFLMEDIVTKQIVKTRTQNTEVQIFKVNDFETKLQKLGLIDNFPVNMKLFEVLNIDKKYPNILMFKKLKKCLIDLRQNRYAISIGKNTKEINFELDKHQENDVIEIYLDSINHLLQTSKQSK